MNRKNTKFIYNTFYCTQCGNKNYSIPRKLNSQREAGHLKELYCPHCERDINHAECTEFGPYTFREFREEYNLGNFDENGMRINQSWKGCING